MDSRHATTRWTCQGLIAASLLLSVPLAQAQQSVFDTGANAFVTWALAFATPVAVLIVIGVGAAAAIGKISWAWVIGGIVGIAVIFGSEQIVTWIRGLFGV